MQAPVGRNMTENPRMTHFRLTTTMLLLAMASGALAQGTAPDYPKRPIRILVGFSAGSTADLLPRIAGQRMTEAWGQPVIVDNRPSAGGIVAAEIVAKATPDGHTLLSVSAGHAVSAALYKSLPYDTLKDFAGITRFANVPSILVVAPASGIKSVKDIISLAKAKPGTLTYSTPGIGSANHLAGELLKNLAGIDVTHVPFKGIPEAMTATMTGTITFNLSPVLNVVPLVNSGKLLAIATTTGARASALPDVPTIGESGVKGYAFDPWFGILTTARTPRAIVNRLNHEIVRSMELPEIKARLATLGAEPAPLSPDQFDAHIRSEVEKFRKIVASANIKVE